MLVYVGIGAEDVAPLPFPLPCFLLLLLLLFNDFSSTSFDKLLDAWARLG